MANREDILTTIAGDLCTSLSYHREGTVVIPVEPDSYQTFFKSVYNSVMSCVYPNAKSVPGDIISEQDFVFVCESFLKSRLDFVHSRVFGTLVCDRFAIPGTHMPASLYKVIKSIGIFTVFEGNVKVVPKPGNFLPSSTSPITTQRMFSRFSTLVESFPNRRWSSASPSLTDSESGTPFWVLSARENNNLTAVASERHSVVVLSSFPEWSPEDAILAAIAQNGFDGNIGDYGMLYRSDEVKDALLLRQRFHLKVAV